MRSLAVLLALVSSCALEVGGPDGGVTEETARPGDPLYVEEAPPPPRSDVIVGEAPGPDYVWVGGSWTRVRAEWRWIPGCWTRRPRPEAVWEPGRWERRPGGRVWIDGSWK